MKIDLPSEFRNVIRVEGQYQELEVPLNVLKVSIMKYQLIVPLKFLW